MEKQLPKNVRQIGNISDNPKVYVEDYVDTYLSQLCDKVDQAPVGAILIGETAQYEDQDCVFVSGAIQLNEIEIEGNEITIKEDTWKQAYEDCKEFFGSDEVLGWYLTASGMPLTMNNNLSGIHEKALPKEHSIFIMKDPVEKEEQFYVYKYKNMLELGGHYIYYQKNPNMQEYMIATRKKIGVTPSEVVEDRAAKDFRSVVKERMEKNEPKRVPKFTYVASTFLLLVVLVIGVTTVNNYGKMQSVQSAIENIAGTLTGGGSDNEAKETSGAIVNGKGDGGDIQAPAEKGDTPVKSDDKADANEEGQASEPENAAQGSDEGAQDDAKAEDAKAPEPDAVQSNTDLGIAEEDFYVVQKGDTLATISKKMYGNTAQIDAICRMNGLTDGNLIFIGQKLLLP